MNTLIINLTRFGDLLQTQPVAHNLHSQGHTVGLVCLDTFAEAAKLLEHVDYLAPLPGPLLLGELSKGWPGSLAALHTWLHTLVREFQPERIINLTATTAARLLARRMACPGTTIWGFGLDEHGFGVTGSTWTAFFEASTRTRGCSPYNLVDIFARAAGCQGLARYELKQPASTLRALMGNKLAAQSPPDCKGYVAFQLGASEARRRWPAAYFAGLGARLWNEHRIMPVLVGSAAERNLAEQYQQAGGAAIDMLGATNLPELGALLLSMRFLLTNDTGTMHLAAGLGVPSLALFLATAQAWDTGAYLEDCCLVEPDIECHPCAFGSQCPHNLACVTRIQPQALWPLLEARIATGRWPAALPSECTGLRAWISHKDSMGFMNLSALSGHEHTDRTAWIRLQRHYYGQFFDECDGLSSPDACSLLPAPPEYAAALSPQWRSACLASLEQAEAFIHLFCEQGRLTLKEPSGPHAQRFMSTCHRVSGVFEANPAFHVLGRLWENVVQEKGGNLLQCVEFGMQFRQLLRSWHENLSLAQ